MENPLAMDDDVNILVSHGRPNSVGGSALGHLREGGEIDKEQLSALLQQALHVLNSPQGQFYLPQNRDKKRRLGGMLVSKLVLWSAIWVALTIGILSLLDATIPADEVDQPTRNSGFVAGAVIIIILQLIHIVLVVAISVKLTKQMLHHTASSNFLVQSYCSTILLYSAVYTLLYRLDSNCFVTIYQGSPLDSSYVSQVFVRMLYFSISTFTSTGYGDIVPTSWYTYLLVSSQMLLGVLYGTVILARGMDLLARTTAASTNASASSSALPAMALPVHVRGDIELQSRHESPA